MTVCSRGQPRRKPVLALVVSAAAVLCKRLSLRTAFVPPSCVLLCAKRDAVSMRASRKRGMSHEERAAQASSWDVDRIDEMWEVAGGMLDVPSRPTGPPTAKQLAYARSLAKRAGVKPPDGFDTNKGTCSSFIDEMLQQFDGSPPASEKQIAYAQRLAKQAGVKPSDGFEKSSVVCSKFIDDMLRELGGQEGVKAPASAPGKSKSFSAFIDNQKSKLGHVTRPSDKQIAYAQALAKSNNVTVPPSALEDASLCSQFIDEQLANTPRRSAGSVQGPPSEKAVQYARGLAKSARETLPPEALNSQWACSQYIEKKLADGFKGTPTKKQIQYAENLASRMGSALPKEVYENAVACSKFIDACKNSAPPSKKQIQYAENLASRSGSVLPKEVYESARACSKFIDAQKLQQR